MNSAVYNIGVQLALADAGLIKEATWGAGLKRLSAEALGGIKNFVTGKRLRDALTTYKTVGKSPATIDPTKIQEAIAHLALDKPAVNRAREALEAGMTAAPDALARREIYKAIRPYAVLLGGAGASYGGYKGVKALYPKLGD